MPAARLLALALLLPAAAAAQQAQPVQGQAAPPAQSQTQGQQAQGEQAGTRPAEPGFRLDLAGRIGPMGQEQLAEAVRQALPEALTDPQRNFRTKAVPDGDYRLVMVFHGQEALAADGLCARTVESPQAVQAAPAQPDLAATTHVTAAFCDGDRTLSAAADRMTGEVVPGQASFRFLVADIAKQLFPSGFDVLPGTEGAAATATRQP
ncbi:MAG TPA: hypothetical protein VEB20_18725 [Azospirillaceae bacterium]|nr:hypothetical protein [Azospirillaceae bacterium]